MSDTKKKISAWIPAALYDKLETLGYNSPTIAITKALEMLVRAESGDNPETIGDIPETDLETARRQLETIRTQMQAEIDSLQNDIERLTLALQEAPNPIELVKLQGKYEGLQMLLEEKEKRIESLENDLKKADLDKEDLKQMHNNYFLQVQTLINQKAIGSPKESKQAVREDKQAPKEKPQQKTDKPTEKAEKTLIEKTCKNCNETFFTENPRKETCSDKCRRAYSRKNRR